MHHTMRKTAASGLVAMTSLLGIAGTASAAGCGTPRDPGRAMMEIRSGDKVRQIAYFIPSGYDGSRKVPVVFDFHGSTSSANEQLDRSEWERVAEAQGFIAVAPQGLMPGQKPDTFSWNVPGVTAPGGPDDMAFIHDAIRAVEETFCVDDTKIFGTGYSGGGRVLSQYICNGTTDFAAAGFVVGLRAGYPKETAGTWAPDSETCKPARPLSLIAFAGRQDKINPFDGGGLPYWQYGAQAALQRWTELDGCKGEPTVTENGTVRTVRYENCAGKARIVSTVISDGGHTWPSSTALLRYQKQLGKISYAVNATDAIWRFFETAAP
ncbi:polyhydroxybutyrate depolymerase [Rhizobium sp. RU35A]|nr:polyhydroxybutyrate depolymerase [Rhizobium sp. RU35A]